MNELIEKFAPVLSGRRNPQHPEVVVWLCNQRWIDRRKIRCEAVVNFRSLNQFITLQIHDETHRPALANFREQVRHLAILIVDRTLQLEHIDIQSSILFEAVNEVETVTGVRY